MTDRHPGPIIAETEDLREFPKESAAAILEYAGFSRTRHRSHSVKNQHMTLYLPT